MSHDPNDPHLKLWSIWVRQGLLTQDRGRGESPLRHWVGPIDRQALRQKRVDYLESQIGTPARRRAEAKREARVRQIRREIASSW